MIGILLLEGVVLVVLDQSWLRYGWPTYVGVTAIVVALGVWAALTLIERRIERAQQQR